MHTKVSLQRALAPPQIELGLLKGFLRTTVGGLNRQLDISRILAQKLSFLKVQKTLRADPVLYNVPDGSNHSYGEFLARNGPALSQMKTKLSAKKGKFLPFFASFFLISYLP